ncbi:hypothetical protein GWQ43_05625 [Alcaligenes faecalis]|uniref:hypothetical protein n=1 Tax=Alcaligenes faecalis TaxID=511 RepID=UPI00137C05D4|nr:hypothetical protein [Alcaligenes faecalis]QHS35587.1 hypothetical protein GWQ43_05625 [Alcaligenes faecalis]
MTAQLLGLIEQALGLAGEQPREYDLHLVAETDWLVSRGGEIARLDEGTTQRVVVANLTRGHLQAIRRSQLPDLTSFADCKNSQQLNTALKVVRSFRSIRNIQRAPFWGALSLSSKPYELDLRIDKQQQVAEEYRESVTAIDVIAESRDTPRLSCTRLDPRDLQLIDLWQQGRMSHQASEKNERRERFSLLSLGYARLAEKLVLQYLRMQHPEALDVSITQLDGVSPLWKSCDIEAGMHVDVKNATMLGSRKRHVFVPKFKKIADNDVFIAGVISTPFSKFVENRRRKKKFMGGRLVQYVRQTFLGFASLTKLAKVQNAINRLPGRRQDLQISFHENALPPWAFEASDGRDPAKLFNIATLIAREPTTIIAASFACGQDAPDFLVARLNAGQRAVYDQFRRVVSEASYTKATIAMFAISEFIAWTIDARNAAGLMRFLRRINSIEDFTSGRAARFSWSFASKQDRRNEKYEIEIDHRGSCCGGLYDPTMSIDTIFDLLEKCAEQIAVHSLTFTHFDVPNPYILVGRAESGREITLYAYCGGTLMSGARCNHFPLVIGKNGTCPSCNRLICEECAYCSDRCPSLPERKAAKEKNTRAEGGREVNLP